MALSGRTLTIANTFFDILNGAKLTLNLADVWFGDQSILPRTPALCVEPGVKRRDLKRVQFSTDNNIDTYLLLYHSKLGPETDQQVERRKCVEFAENIEEFMHINHIRLFDTYNNQLTIDTHCTDLDPGFSYKSGTLYNAVRMTWTSLTKTYLQQPG